MAEQNSLRTFLCCDLRYDITPQNRKKTFLPYLDIAFDGTRIMTDMCWRAVVVCVACFFRQGRTIYDTGRMNDLELRVDAERCIISE